MDKAVRKMYKSREVLPNVWCISSTAVMCWLVIGKTGAMLVDTAYGYEDLSQAVREITKLPLTVVNTHTHIDHSGGNFFFDSPVYISEADRALYDIHSKAQAHREMEKTLRIFKYIVFWRNVLPRDPERNDSRRENFNNFKYVKDGDSFDLGGMTAIIVEIPGHTQGSIAVYLPEKNAVITSDGANSATWLFLPESANLSVYRNSLKKLKSLNAEHFLTGHSANVFTGADLDKWLEVAENPDISGAKPQKTNFFAPNAEPVAIWSKSDPKHKGPNILIDKSKLI